MKMTQKQKLTHLKTVKYEVISFKNGRRTGSYGNVNAIQAAEDIAQKSLNGCTAIMLPMGFLTCSETCAWDQKEIEKAVQAKREKQREQIIKDRHAVVSKKTIQIKLDGYPCKLMFDAEIDIAKPFKCDYRDQRTKVLHKILAEHPDLWTDVCHDVCEFIVEVIEKGKNDSEIWFVGS